MAIDPSYTWRALLHARDLDEQGHDPSTWKDAVDFATTGNGTLATAFAAGQVVDGVTLVAGMRGLLKDQTAGEVNGIYVVPASGAPVRAEDFDTTADVLGALIYVIRGTANGGQIYRNTNTSAPTIGTTALTFSAFTPVTLHWEPHISYDGTVVFDGIGNPVMIEVS